jgi:uncharacterized protein (TIGR03067 family)
MTPSLLIGLALTVGAPIPKDKPKTEPKLEGDWVVESFEPQEGGPKEKSVTFTFTADRILIHDGMGKKPEEAGYSADLKKKPATIDIKPGRVGGPGGAGGPPPDLVVRGIIEIDGDTMKLCFTKEGERPTEFKGDAEKRTLLITFKRVKADK